MAKITFSDIGKSVKVSFGDKKGNYGFMELELPKSSTPLVVEEDNVHLTFYSNGDRITIDFNDVDTPTDSIDASDLRNKLSDLFFKESLIFDVNARTYFDAAGITDLMEKNAVNTLVIELKNSGVWNKVSVMYMISPTSLAAAAVNARNPGTNDITWVGSPTHSITGVDYNGTNQYGKTGLIAGSDPLMSGLAHGGVYQRETVAGGLYAFGSDEGGDVNFHMNPREASNATRISINGQGSLAVGSTTDERGWMCMDKDAIPNHYIIYTNGLETGDAFPAVINRITTIEIYLGALNNSGSPINFTNKQAAFYSFGETLTPTQHLDYYNAIQTYQTNVIEGGRHI